MLQWFPLLLIKCLVSIKSLDGLQGCLIHAISSTDHINVSGFNYGHSMVMPRLLKVTNFCPFILWNIIHFAFLWCVIWIFRTYSVNEIFRLVIKFSVEMSELMTRSCVVHKRSFFYLICKFIDNVALVWEHASDIVLLLFSTDEKDFVLTLDRCEFLWQNFSVSDWNFDCCLSI